MTTEKRPADDYDYDGEDVGNKSVNARGCASQRHIVESFFGFAEVCGQLQHSCDNWPLCSPRPTLYRHGSLSGKVLRPWSGKVHNTVQRTAADLQGQWQQTYCFLIYIYIYI